MYIPTGTRAGVSPFFICRFAVHKECENFRNIFVLFDKNSLIL